MRELLPSASLSESIHTQTPNTSGETWTFLSWTFNINAEFGINQWMNCSTNFYDWIHSNVIHSNGNKIKCILRYNDGSIKCCLEIQRHSIKITNPSTANCWMYHHNVIIKLVNVFKVYWFDFYHCISPWSLDLIFITGLHLDHWTSSLSF